MKEESSEKMDMLLAAKCYEELSPKEKAWVDEELGGAYAYKLLSDLVRTANTEHQLNVNPKVKSALLKEFKTRNASAWDRIVYFKVPAYAVAVCLWLMAMIVLLFTSSERNSTEPITYSYTEFKADTVIMYVRDTVYIERMVKTPVYISLKESENGTDTVKNKITNIPSKSMADQTDLRGLLVRSE